MKIYLVKKCLIFGIIFLLIGLTVKSLGVNIKNINTKNTIFSIEGTILYVGGSGPGNYTTIQSAINDANSGDKIFVYDDNSPYSEHLVIDKSINLIGENKVTTVIDGGGSGNVIFIIADGVNITGFTIRNSGTVIYAGIKVVSDHNMIYGNIFLKNDDCIWLDWSSYNSVFNNNLIKNTGFGIFLYQAQNNIIRNNHIEECNKFGIYLFVKSKNNLVTGNTIDNCDDGIFTEDTSLNIYSNNTITQCITGFRGKTTTDNIIIGNNISYNNCGLSLGEFSDSVITKNSIDNNEQAIYLGASLHNKITLNNIEKNIAGIYLWDSSNDNLICYNNFINTFRAAFFADSSNQWNQNFWNKPRNNPKLIIGGKTIKFLAYLMPWLEIEWYPAIEPVDIYNPQACDIDDNLRTIYNPFAKTIFLLERLLNFL